MGHIESFSLSLSPLSRSLRTIWIYLPDDYADSVQSYPVLYMFDGHNLFHDALATYGRSWRLGHYLDQYHIPLLVIGMDCNHIGDGRLEEYCPVSLAPHSRIDGLYDTSRLHPCGKQMAQWMIEVLMPYCTAHYRIKKTREDTAIGGSSMGGLMALYMSICHRAYFSKAACLSPTLDIAADQLLENIRKASPAIESRIFLSCGEKEYSSKRALSKQLIRLLSIHNALLEKKAAPFLYLQPKGKHDEASWERQIPIFLKTMWPSIKSAYPQKV